MAENICFPTCFKNPLLAKCFPLRRNACVSITVIKFAFDKLVSEVFFGKENRKEKTDVPSYISLFVCQLLEVAGPSQILFSVLVKVKLKRFYFLLVEISNTYFCCL